VRVPLKVAVVGCGKIADGHVSEIAKMPELARVVAVYDREPLMAEQLAMRFGVPRHGDHLADLLQTDPPDVVHVTTPPHSHVTVASAAMEAGSHVFVEKPLALSHAESARLIDLASSSRRKLTVGYSYLFDPPSLAMRQLLKEGRIGKPVHLESFFGYDLGGAFGQALLADADHWVHRLPGGLFHNVADHLLNKVVEFLDDEFPRVHAEAWVRRRQRFADRRDTMGDELRVLLRGGDVSAYGTFSSHVMPVQHYLRLFGTRGTVHVDFVSRTVTSEPPTTLPSAVGRLLPAFVSAGGYAREGLRNVWRFARSDFHYFAGFNKLLRLFYESIRDEGPPPIEYRDILLVSRMMDEIFAQIGAPRTDA
jgi:predicted dehydrogenase